MQFDDMLRNAGISDPPACWARFFHEAMAQYAPQGPLIEGDLLWVPEGEWARVQKLWDRVREDEALSRFLFLLRFIAMEKHAALRDWPTPGEHAGGDWFYLLVLLSNMGHLRRDYKERGIPEGIMADTLSDLPRYLYETRHIHGRDGIADVPLQWMALHFSGRVFRLGRLQFEPTVLNESFTLPGGQRFDAGSDVLSAHIPTGSPLLTESFRASFSAAKPFFEKHFPERKFAAISCCSWLLDPVLANLLPEDSNILKFQREFIHVATENVDHSVYKHVFGCPYTEHLGELPEKTSLQRSLKAFLKDGNEIHAALGIMPLP